MRPYVPVALLLLFAPLGFACSGSSGASNREEPAPEAGARLVVDNRSTQDMDIYVRGAGGAPSRLGLAVASDTTLFTLSPALIVGAKSLRFEARPTGGGQSVLSDQFDVRSGEEVNWSIPPQ
jgi:hypothetical protein